MEMSQMTTAVSIKSNTLCVCVHVLKVKKLACPLIHYF